METAVLIHGCHIGAEGWESVVWGDPKNGILGRAAKGILEAVKLNAKMVVFSTGASEKGGIKEGQYTLQFAEQRLEELGSLYRPDGTEGLRSFLKERAVLELTSQNTRDEILASARLARSRGIGRLVLVTSQSHVMRAHQEAISALSSDPELRYFLHNLYATASDTCYWGTKIEDVVIFEPPHRGDRPKHDLHKHVRATRRVPPERMSDFLVELDALVAKYTHA